MKNVLVIKKCVCPKCAALLDARVDTKDNCLVLMG